jgi:hypothetical protein
MLGQGHRDEVEPVWITPKVTVTAGILGRTRSNGYGRCGLFFQKTGNFLRNSRLTLDVVRVPEALQGFEGNQPG